MRGRTTRSSFTGFGSHKKSRSMYDLQQLADEDLDELFINVNNRKQLWSWMLTELAMEPLQWLAISYYLQMLIDSMAKQYSGTDCRAAFGLIRLRPGALVTFFIQSSILLDFIIYFLFGGKQRFNKKYLYLFASIISIGGICAIAYMTDIYMYWVNGLILLGISIFKGLAQVGSASFLPAFARRNRSVYKKALDQLFFYKTALNFVLSALFLPFVFKLAVPRGIPTECDEYEVASNYVDICRLAVFFSALWWLGLMCWSIFCPAHVTQENTNTPGYISVAHQNSNCCTLTSKAASVVYNSVPLFRMFWAWVFYSGAISFLLIVVCNFAVQELGATAISNSALWTEIALFSLIGLKLSDYTISHGYFNERSLLSFNLVSLFAATLIMLSGFYVELAPWSKWVIYTLGAFIGLNAVPAYWNSRNLYLSLTPLTAEEMDINYLFTLVAKFTAVIGPVLATLTYDEWSTFRWAFFFPAIALFIGASLLQTVPIPSTNGHGKNHHEHSTLPTTHSPHHFEETNFDQGVLHHHYHEEKYAQS
jgi:MFS-type transporter involved in bile tolerance (Atg22 family)